MTEYPPAKPPVALGTCPVCGWRVHLIPSGLCASHPDPRPEAPYGRTCLGGATIPTESQRPHKATPTGGHR